MKERTEFGAVRGGGSVSASASFRLRGGAKASAPTRATPNPGKSASKSAKAAADRRAKSSTDQIPLSEIHSVGKVTVKRDPVLKAGTMPSFWNLSSHDRALAVDGFIYGRGARKLKLPVSAIAQRLNAARQLGFYAAIAAAEGDDKKAPAGSSDKKALAYYITRGLNKSPELGKKSAILNAIGGTAKANDKVAVATKLARAATKPKLRKAAGPMEKVQRIDRAALSANLRAIATRQKEERAARAANSLEPVDDYADQQEAMADVLEENDAEEKGLWERFLEWIGIN